MNGNINEPEENANNDSEAVKLTRIHARYHFGGQAIKGFVWIAVAICTYLSIMSLAGETTELIGALVIWAQSYRSFSWLLLGAALLWVWRERRTRTKMMAHMEEQNKNLERQLDTDQNSPNWLKADGATKMESRDDPNRIR